MARAFLWAVALAVFLVASIGCSSTPHPNPTPSGAVSGSIEWQSTEEGGNTVRYLYAAESSDSDVVEMRHSQALACGFAADEVAWSEWVPYATEEMVRLSPLGNFDAAARYVQYRDGAGNVSEAYCAEIVTIVPSPSPIVVPISTPATETPES